MDLHYCLMPHVHLFFSATRSFFHSPTDISVRIYLVVLDSRYVLYDFIASAEIIFIFIRHITMTFYFEVGVLSSDFDIFPTI